MGKTIISILLPKYLLISNYEKEVLNRGSYTSAQVLLNLLNKLRKRDKMLGKPGILRDFHNKFNKFNKTGAQMLDSVYHMTLKLF